MQLTVSPKFQNGSPAPTGPEARVDPEVIPAPPQKPKRRQFSARYKLRVLEETDRLPDGELGAYLRKHGLYSSHLSSWRRLRAAGTLTALGSRPSPRKKPETEPAERALAATRKELDAVREQLRQANLILEVQKKVLLLCEDVSQSKSRTSCSRP